MTPSHQTALSADEPQADEPGTATVQRPRRRMFLAGGIAAALVLGGSAAAVAHAHKTVQIDVDGETIEVSTFAGSVAGVLDAEGITLGEHDVVVPGLDEPLTEGADVVVQYASPIQLEVDGEPTTIWSVADSADALLATISASGREPLLTASRSEGRPALDLPLVAGGDVIFKVDGESTTITIDGAADLPTALLKAEIQVGDTDHVEVGVDADGTAVVTITRITTQESTRTEELPYETIERGTDDLYKGEERVAAEGTEGERTFTYRDTLVDGEVVSSQLIGTEITAEPQNRIIEYGTAERPAPPPPSNNNSGSSGGGGSAPSGGVWAALAQCESGGNPATNTGNGYYGLYQFSLSTWQSVGGSGLPSEASAAEQTERAQILQARSGWGQWPACAAKLGLL